MKKLLGRFREPSTWAAIAAPLFAFGVIDHQQAQAVMEAGATVAQSASDPLLNLGIIGGAVSTLLAAFLPERGQKE